jgi:DNA-directed RNA polymerase subunit M/transcription elongation factor TFIIS
MTSKVVKFPFTVCSDCGALLEIPSDCENNEIISCSGCGQEYVLSVEIVNGQRCVTDIKRLELTEKEDWGE